VWCVYLFDDWEGELWVGVTACEMGICTGVVCRVYTANAVGDFLDLEM
jgi:hypothetical protein